MNNPYILYVGSAYPHKNIPIIFKALKKLPHLTLVLVSSRNVFLDRVKETAKQAGVLDQLNFAGFKTDAEIATLYQEAVALVHPSKSEGFGLTGLEAMQAGCPVIAANATCLPEIYGDGALYFDPDNGNQLMAHINTLLSNPTIRNQQVERGKAQVKKYSWDTMVAQTINIYHQALRTNHQGRR